MRGGLVREFAAVLVILCSPAGASVIRQEAEKTTVEQDENFSGTVVTFSAMSVAVVRTSPSNESVRHIFLLDAQTLIEGKLKAKARVTVRYKASSDGALHAIHIIVRTAKTISGAD